MTFATIWLAGHVVMQMGMPDPAICPDMIDTMRSDTIASYQLHPFGLTTDNGAILRATDWKFTCEDERLLVKQDDR